MLYFSRKYSHVNAHANVLLYVTWDNKEEKMEYAAEAISDEASEITPNDLAGDYACIAEIIGIENTILLHKHYRGQQITLPQRLYSVQYVVKEVERQLGTHSLSDLAKKYGYTERRLRQLIKEDSKL